MMKFKLKLGFALSFSMALALAMTASAKSSFEGFPPVKKGGVLIDAVESNPTSLIPMLATNYSDRELYKWLFMSLMERDYDTYVMQPGLAEKLEVSSDKTEYTFTLNPKATWSDGSRVTADDMVFTFGKIMDPKVNAAPVRAFLEGVTLSKIDDRRFTFKVQKPKYDTGDFLCTLYPMQKKQFENDADFNKAKDILRPIGTGPYKMKQISRDQFVLIERDANWWAKDLPHGKARANFDQVQFKIISDPALRYEAWIKGDIDTLALTAEQLSLQALGTDQDKVAKEPGTKKALWAKAFSSEGTLPWWGIALNFKTAIFAGVKTRQALANLVDYETVKKNIYYNLVERSVSPFGSKSQNVSPEFKNLSKAYRFDMKNAMALLKADGWADTDGDSILDKDINGKRVPFKFTYTVAAANPLAVRFAQFYKETLKKAGIEVEVKPTESATFFKAFDDSQFDAIQLSWSGASIYPNPKQLWATSSIAGGSNKVGYSNPKVDALIEKANLEFNHAKRAKILQEINRMIYNEVPYIFLFERNSIFQGLSSKLKSPRWSARYGIEVDKQFFHF